MAIITTNAHGPRRPLHASRRDRREASHDGTSPPDSVLTRAARTDCCLIWQVLSLLEGQLFAPRVLPSLLDEAALATLLQLRGGFVTPVHDDGVRAWDPNRRARWESHRRLIGRAHQSRPATVWTKLIGEPRLIDETD